MTPVSGGRTNRATCLVALLLLQMTLHEPAAGSDLQAHAFLHRSLLQTCQPSGSIPGKSGSCNTENGSECCKDGQSYTTYDCSPPVTGSTRATLTLNSFAEGGDGGGASACPPYKFYDDSKKVVALSTGWYANGSRCHKHILIRAVANGNIVRTRVVDECDSTVGCDEEHNFEPPCHKNIVDGSPAVWDALGLNKDDGEAQITWSEE
ncbi:hypothetical protein PR202_gb07024 [Eleusine coracana subsp. coracana]|uniref:Ripening-related protein n=1 Tax=Eleusine coracana subsp. coracana TaxID=191504 RepID=A0AAV5EBL0_ELECO|nr:hypothetical protein PR202_gb07024 [Eleusine coracana subsp. coracana]